MRRLLPFLLAGGLLVQGCAQPEGVAGESGDVRLLTAARIHTSDPSRPVAEAIAWDGDGRIVAVGSADDLRASWPQAEVLDLEGATVVPGSASRDAAATRSAARVRQRVAGVLLPGISAACAAVLIVTLRPTAERALGGQRVELHVIDVGQGDAIAIRSPRGRWALIDAGPRGRSYDAGVARVQPYLSRRQAHALSVLVVTHPDADHIGGAASTMEALPVHALLEPVQPDPRRMYLQTLDAARRRGTRLIAARAGTRVVMDGVELEVLFPADRLAPPERANDNSAVILLRFGTFHALLLGDAPVSVEQWIARQYGPELRAQVLKVGHHGSSTSTGDVLLAAIRPALALIPVGRQNRYGHPAPDVLARLRRNGIPVLRTDERGAIVVRADAGGRMRVETER